MARAGVAPECFGVVFERHFEAVFRFCERRVGRAAAEDLAGETFRRAFEGRGGYDGERGDARPWLFGIALNVVRSELRSRAIRDRAYGRLAGMAVTGEADNVSGMLGRRAASEELAVVAGLLVRLPEDDVEALLLHVWDGLSYAEVAVALGVPVGTVRSRLSRLRRRLAVLLAETTSGWEGSGVREARG